MAHSNRALQLPILQDYGFDGWKTTKEELESTFMKIVSRSLNELLEKHGNFSVLLIDIEGGEYNFIMENKEAIRNFSKIIIEQHDFIIGPKKVGELKEILQNLDFSFKENSGASEVWLKNH